MPFQAKITRVRFVLGPFTSEDMLDIGNVVVESIKTRLHKGLNINDQPAKPLKPGRNGKKGYPEYKAGRGLQPFRDWFWTGRTLRSLKVKSASENRCVIGFIDPNADRIAHINNIRERAFGISPKDRQAMVAVIKAVLRTARVIQVRKAA